MEEKTQCKESNKETNAGRTGQLYYVLLPPFGALVGCDESLTALNAAEKSGTSLVSLKTTTLNCGFYSIFMQRIIVINLAFKSKI